MWAVVVGGQIIGVEGLVFVIKEEMWLLVEMVVLVGGCNLRY